MLENDSIGIVSSTFATYSFPSKIIIIINENGEDRLNTIRKYLITQGKSLFGKGSIMCKYYGPWHTVAKPIQNAN